MLTKQKEKTGRKISADLYFFNFFSLWRNICLKDIAVIRHGVRIVQIDPWNRLESAREKNESETDYIETDYILRCLRSLYVFAHDMNCHVQIVAHPAKMGQERRNRSPFLEDIARRREIRLAEMLVAAAHSIRASAQVTAPGAATNMIVAVSTRPNRQNRSTCSRMSVASVQKQ
jgi:hypothetical protein